MFRSFSRYRSLKYINQVVVRSACLFYNDRFQRICDTMSKSNTRTRTGSTRPTPKCCRPKQLNSHPYRCEKFIHGVHGVRTKKTTIDFDNNLSLCHGYEDKISALPTTSNSADWSSLVDRAHHSLTSGNIIAVPTDTIYGIAGLAQSTSAIRKLYSIKGRDLSKPISISVGDLKDVYKWGVVTIPECLLSELLPGPVTVVFTRTGELNPELNPGTTRVGIRVPDSGFVRDVSRKCGEPLALTSANISNQPSSLCIQEFEDLWSELDVVFDGGVLGATPDSKKGSTVVDLSTPGFYKVTREGSAFTQTVATLERHGLRSVESPDGVVLESATR